MTDPRPEDRQFEMELAIAAPPEAVFRALADAQELMRWFAPHARVEPGVGGSMCWEWEDHYTWPMTIEAWSPGRHLRTRYDSTVDDGVGGKRPLFIDFHLEGDRGVTTLRIVHSGFGPEASFDDEFDGIRSGWPVELRSLKHYLENHAGSDRHAASAMATTTLDPEEAWNALLGPDGLGAAGVARATEGGRFAVAVPAGPGRIEGRVLYARAYDVVGLPDNLGDTAQGVRDGWFRVHCGDWGRGTQVWIWLAMYRADAGALVGEYQTAFDAILQRVLPQLAGEPQT